MYIKEPHRSWALVVVYVLIFFTNWEPEALALSTVSRHLISWGLPAFGIVLLIRGYIGDRKRG
jgi:hypothetical protein